MNPFTLSALIAFILYGMGITALILGAYNVKENEKSKTSVRMFWVCVCVFVWNLGYAWMSLCHNDSFAYTPRAMALLAVTFYVYAILKYVIAVTDYPAEKLIPVFALYLALSLTSWALIIQPSAVTFVSTPWGFWYYSKMSFARILQFASFIIGTVCYYVIVIYGLKKTTLQRDRFVLRRFLWFGPILYIGYMFDTLIPSLFKTPAIPGSSISAFCSAMILFHISQKNRVFGLSKANVSKYVFEDVHLPVIITDNQGEIVLCNKFACDYLNRDSRRLIGYTLDKFFEADESEILKVIGLNRECKVDKTIVNDQFNALLYSIYFFNDVTQERQAFRMLEESRMIAEEANRAKSNFLANMSHEIRTPMNAIIGMSDIILQSSDIPEKTLSQVNEINVAGHNLLGIINDILDISKIEAGKYELITDEYELPSLIHDVSNIISIRLQETNAAFVVKLDETLPKKLIGDVGRIRQILLNILGNAVKFIKKGSVTFSVTWNKDKGEPKLMFDVADTGIGIKPEDIDKIFGSFSQVDTRKNRNIQGTGLGLAISKHMAELMGGNITVDSVYGEGSTFHITICQGIKFYEPLGEQLKEALENRQYRTVVAKKTVNIVPRPNAKVLIVDDTKVNLMVARGIMKKYGMQIDTATSGKEAIEKVQQTDYDIVFMDHMMPEMDGVEATKKIRELGDKFKKLTIIALTANAISEAKEMFLQEGLQDFLAKPIETNALDDILNRWIPVETK